MSAKKTSKRTAGSRKRSSPPRRAPRRRKAARRGERNAPHALVAFADLAEQLRLRWYVFGAHAVALHGYPRTTADLDLTIDLQSHDLDAFLAALRNAGFSPRFDDRGFLLAARVIPVVHSTGIPIDLVLAGPGLEQRFLDEVERRTLAGRQIPVLSAENLVVTKVLAGRPKDLEDVRELNARGALDHARIEHVLREIEVALGQRDLVPLYRALRER